MQIFENVRFTHCNYALYASLAEAETEGTLEMDMERGNVTFKYSDTKILIENVARISIEETGVSVAVNEQKEYYFELPSPEYEEEVLEEPQAV